MVAGTLVARSILVASPILECVGSSQNLGQFGVPRALERPLPFFTQHKVYIQIEVLAATPQAQPLSHQHQFLPSFAIRLRSKADCEV